MSAEVASVMAQLAVLQREILDPVTGDAITAYANVPYTTSVASMPCFINYAGPLSSNTVIGSDDNAREMREVRMYEMVFYHSAYGSGIEGEKVGLLLPYYQLVYEKFGAYPHLKNLGGIIDAVIASDSGMGTVTFVNQTYYGTRFRLQVTGRVRRVLGTND
jgi:hypothetical protein